ncbi:BglII/BstYI family type II restriction endonuclease [Sphingomonas endophytica]|uniref:BglII/BstYI family type II restriction endonuclease n=1 Tax=Sphingomonas endophytica TaxID=869719 RepID=UPI0009FB8E77|nr:BglII/BstYI family type II restriction endonuclease [Sphingomonas endophytica]
MADDDSTLGGADKSQLENQPATDAPDAGLEDASSDDVALHPEAADSQELVNRIIPEDVRKRYEVYSYRNAALVLKEANPSEFEELMEALRKFRLTTSLIREAGGNESAMPKLFSGHLRPLGWHETTIQADLLVKLLWKEPEVTPRGRKFNAPKDRQLTRARFLDGHKVDYVKNRVAFDLEWNSKDQTFDRDLYAFSAFSQCGVIDVGVLVTRGASLTPVFRALGPDVQKKYGASTTWMGKLLYRLNAGRNGPCPVLAFGIRPECIEDWTPRNAI